MKQPAPSDQAAPQPGLRERKKARTRASIQREAVRLFREQGYSATTVDQVAQAAEVAPSTVFRYFPTKQDLALSNDYELPFATMLQAQSRDVSPLRAERQAIRAILDDLPGPELALQRDRWLLIVSEPELWGASLGAITQTLRVMSEELAKHTGREADDPAVRAHAGAVFGVMLQVSLQWVEDPELDFARALDEALRSLETLSP